MVFPSIQDTVTLSEDCLNGQNIRASYELSYTTAVLSLLNVLWMECSNGT